MGVRAHIKTDFISLVFIYIGIVGDKIPAQ